jgi:hypothetical protein
MNVSYYDTSLGEAKIYNFKIVLKGEIMKRYVF